MYPQLFSAFPLPLPLLLVLISLCCWEHYFITARIDQASRWDLEKKRGLGKETRVRRNAKGRGKKPTAISWGLIEQDADQNGKHSGLMWG